MEWLSKQDSNVPKRKTKYLIQVSEMINPQSNNTKSDVVILPLSLQDNLTITGTACILEEFGKEFSISYNHDTHFLTFDYSTKTFDLKGARSRFEFLTLLEKHKSEMKELKLPLDRREKGIECATLVQADDKEDTCFVTAATDGDEECDDDGDGENAESRETPTKSKKNMFQKIDGKFNKMVW